MEVGPMKSHVSLKILTTCWYIVFWPEQMFMLYLPNCLITRKEGKNRERGRRGLFLVDGSSLRARKLLVQVLLHLKDPKPSSRFETGFLFRKENPMSGHPCSTSGLIKEVPISLRERTGTRMKIFFRFIFFHSLNHLRSSVKQLRTRAATHKTRQNY